MPASKKTRHIMVSHSTARKIRDAMSSELNAALSATDFSALKALDGHDFTLRDGDITWKFSDPPTRQDNELRDRNFCPNPDGPHMALLIEHVAPVFANINFDAVAEKCNFDYELSWKNTVISVSIDQDDEDPEKVGVMAFIWLPEPLDFVQQFVAGPLRAAVLHHYPTVIEPPPASPVTASLDPVPDAADASSASRKRSRCYYDSFSASDDDYDDDEDDNLI